MGNPIPSRDAQPVAWLYCSDDGSQELLLDCNGEQARRLIELGWTEQPLFAALPTEAQIRADAYEQAAKAAEKFCDTVFGVRGHQVATAIRALSDQPDSTNEGLAELLRKCREAIASLPDDALGFGYPAFAHDFEEQKWPLRDELLADIDTALSTGRQA